MFTLLASHLSSLLFHVFTETLQLQTDSLTTQKYMFSRTSGGVELDRDSSHVNSFMLTSPSGTKKAIRPDHWEWHQYFT